MVRGREKYHSDHGCVSFLSGDKIDDGFVARSRGVAQVSRQQGEQQQRLADERQRRFGGAALHRRRSLACPLMSSICLLLPMMFIQR